MKGAIERGLLDQEVVHEQLATNVDGDDRRRRCEVWRLFDVARWRYANRRPRCWQHHAVVKRLRIPRLRERAAGQRQRDRRREERASCDARLEHG
jgi:hypothetical protein